VLTTEDLLTFMPKTGSMGEMISFLMTFAYSPPYIPFIPIAGVGADLPFTGPARAACNAALVTYRTAVLTIINTFFADSNVQTQPAQMNFQATPAQNTQWELNIEL